MAKPPTGVGCYGVDFGGHASKVARVRIGADGLKFVTRYEAERTAPASGSAVDEGHGRALLRPLRGWRRRQAVLGLPSSAHEWLTTKLPDADGPEFREMMMNEAGVAFPDGGRVFDGWPLGDADAAGLRPAMLVAADDGAATAAAVAGTWAGLQVSAIDVPPWALARLFAATGDGGPAVAVDLGAGGLTATSCVGGRPAAVRVAPGAGWPAVVGRVASSLGVSAPAAAALLREDGTDAADCVPQAVAPLIETLRQTLSHFGRRNADEGPVVLVGGGAVTPGLPELLSSRLGRLVTRWTAGRDEDCLYAVAAGYSLRPIAAKGATHVG
ncbi:MAG: hypothetical protein AAF532_10705 [Planctomycetota bacterium]